MTKAAYLQTLAHLGMISASAHLTIKTGDPNAYTQIQDDYGQKPNNSITHILKEKKTMDSSVIANLNVNIDRLFHAHPNQSLPDL